MARHKSFVTMRSCTPAPSNSLGRRSMRTLSSTNFWYRCSARTGYWRRGLGWKGADSRLKRDKNFNDSSASSTTDDRRYASTFAKRFMSFVKNGRAVSTVQNGVKARWIRARFAWRYLSSAAHDQEGRQWKTMGKKKRDDHMQKRIGQQNCLL